MWQSYYFFFKKTICEHVFSLLMKITDGRECVARRND